MKMTSTSLLVLAICNSAVILILQVAGTDGGRGNNGKLVDISYRVKSPQHDMSINLRVGEKTSFFEAMITAANKNKYYQFSSDYYGGELKDFLITTINGTSHSKEKSLYWMFYVDGDLSNWGVNHTLVQNGQHFMFKLINPYQKN